MKKITTAAALALSAAMLAGSAPKANATNINRTPGAFGRYVAGAAVEQIFPSDGDLVYLITDDGGERWIICADALAEISQRDVLEYLADTVTNLFPDTTRDAAAGPVTDLILIARLGQQTIHQCNRPLHRCNDGTDGNSFRLPGQHIPPLRPPYALYKPGIAQRTHELFQIMLRNSLVFRYGL